MKKIIFMCLLMHLTSFLYAKDFWLPFASSFDMRGRFDKELRSNNKILGKFLIRVSNLTREVDSLSIPLDPKIENEIKTFGIPTSLTDNTIIPITSIEPVNQVVDIFLVGFKLILGQMGTNIDEIERNSIKWEELTEIIKLCETSYESLMTQPDSVEIFFFMNGKFKLLLLRLYQIDEENMGRHIMKYQAFAVNSVLQE